VNAEELFIANLGKIESIAVYICRSHHVPEYAEDFAGQVRLSLLERNYEIIRKFEGRSQFVTYLTTVMHHLFYQYRVKEWGKWRPSAEAKRIGPAAIALEKLITRDGYCVRDAFQKMMECGTHTAAELNDIYQRLPPRQPRPVLVSDDVLPESAALSAAPDDLIESRERGQRAREAHRVIADAIAKFSAEDQLILRLRYWENRRIAEIVLDLGLDPKKTYKRITKLHKKLRAAAEKGGISHEVLDDLFAHDHEIHIGENDESRPSQEVTGNFGRKGRLS